MAWRRRLRSALADAAANFFRARFDFDNSVPTGVPPDVAVSSSSSDEEKVLVVDANVTTLRFFKGISSWEDRMVVGLVVLTFAFPRAAELEAVVFVTTRFREEVVAFMDWFLVAVASFTLALMVDVGESHEE